MDDDFDVMIKHTTDKPQRKYFKSYFCMKHDEKAKCFIDCEFKNVIDINVYISTYIYKFHP
jgi:hypothetical protein